MNITEEYIWQIAIFIINVGIGCLVHRMELKARKREEARKKAEEDQNQKQMAIEDALRSILRDIIIKTCAKYNEKGEAPIEELENVTDLYKSYKGLNGNGVVETLYKQFLGIKFLENTISHH